MPFDAQYEGRLLIEPPLSPAERRALDAFLGSRRIKTVQGPLDCRRSLSRGHADVLDWNSPAEGQPSLYTGLAVSQDGTTLFWDGNEKPGYLTDWVRYVIDHLLKPGAVFQELSRKVEWGDALSQFTFDHHVSGVLYGASYNDERWRVYVVDNEVEQVEMNIPHDDEAEEEDS
jgi:hypothetical protein